MGEIPLLTRQQELVLWRRVIAQHARSADLLELVTRAHERPLDKHRPLWELHLIEGLRGGRFAVYMKVHHALVDGVGAMKLLSWSVRLLPDPELLASRAMMPLPEPAVKKPLIFWRDHEEIIACPDFELIDDMYRVSDREAFRATRGLARREAILAGGSSGAALWGVRKLAGTLEGPARIVTGVFKI